MSKYPKNPFWETAKTFLWAAVVAVVFRTVAFEPFVIPSESMEPTMLVGDYLFVSKLSYGYGPYSAPVKINALENRLFYTAPQRGDVVVFRLPSKPSISYIKRIIGLPGDTVQVRGGQLYLNNQPVPMRANGQAVMDTALGPANTPMFTETLPRANGTSKAHATFDLDGPFGQLDNTKAFTVPARHYFMMGDNRDRSADSRTPEVAFVPEGNIIGRAVVVVFSVDENFSWFKPWTWVTAQRLNRLAQSIE
jgi:signal peptidase I